jgi:ubiquinone/menaquinone biosynthesis C-methylase UbiE
MSARESVAGGKRSKAGESLQTVGADWETLATKDPLWAVLVDPDKKDGRWDIDTFFQSGAEDWEKQREWLASLQLPTSGTRALDFGCGVGRMVQALAGDFEQVVGIDISETMLDKARELDRSQGRCQFLHNDAPDLHVADSEAPFDFVHTVITLQHVPKELIPVYLTEFVRLLRPGGIISFQLPERPCLSVKGLAFRYLPARLTGYVQRRFYKYPAPMQMNGLRTARVEQVLSAAGARIVAMRDDDSYGGFWHSVRYLATRD